MLNFIIAWNTFLGFFDGVLFSYTAQVKFLFYGNEI